ncbi:DUF2889 domain-containing protein (plasmid) [Cupriavidus pinatubonensis]|nr:DUF2889 domain-containing protein [Cupriavidus pinatubonensis]
MHEDQASSNRGAPPPGGELPLAAPRRHLHIRAVTMQGFRRDDGLWDIEGEMQDSKTSAWPSWKGGEQPPEVPVHHMRVRITLDDNYIVQSVAAALPTVPFPECKQGIPPLQGLVGASIARGWRKALEATLGATKGCTHLRELLMQLGTVAYQTWAAKGGAKNGKPCPNPASDHRRRRLPSRTGTNAIVGQRQRNAGGAPGDDGVVLDARRNRQVRRRLDERIVLVEVLDTVGEIL